MYKHIYLLSRYRFDQADPETWEGFYHIFDEGEFTVKKVSGGSRPQNAGSFGAPGGSDDRTGNGTITPDPMLNMYLEFIDFSI